MVNINNIIHINAEVTRSCNLRCGYCFNNSGKKMSNEFSLDEWKKVLDIASSYGTTSALFTGGEVMARKDSPNIISYALEKGLRTSILSNGLRLNGQYKNMLENLEKVQISLDSASAYSHDSKRGFGSWKVAREAIDYVRRLNVPVEISTTISNENIEELEGIAGIAYMTGSKILVRPMQSIGRATGNLNFDLNSAIERKRKGLESKFGELFIEDFAKYVPVLGEKHDEIVLPQGFVTILPDGQIRGTRQNILELKKAA